MTSQYHFTIEYKSTLTDRVQTITCWAANMEEARKAFFTTSNGHEQILQITVKM